MKVIISVGGRFHAFYLAQQLFKSDYLEKLITSYPKFEVRKYGIPREKTVSIVLKELFQRGWGRLPAVIRESYNPQYALCESFDRSASKNIGQCDICVAWSGFALNTLRRAKEMGAVTVVERGSAHILYQNEILREEYEKLKVRAALPHPGIIEKELKEYQEADFISVPSAFVKKTFLEKGFSEKKIIHVPYGVELEGFSQVSKKDNIFRVVYAGGMTIRKGVHYLLRAFSELNLPNSELLLVGDLSNEMKPFFKKYEGKFKWIGHFPQKELYKHYSQGSVFVIASIEEGLAMVQPQAMACGLPVICTTNTGGEDIVRDGSEGFVVPIRNVESLKDKILFMYENPEICKNMGESAKKRVSGGFTWDDYGKKIINAYRKILL